LQEYIRARLFTGFPWLLLAYTQTNGSLTQIIASHAIPWSFLYSDEAITGIITIFSGLLAWLGLQNSRSYRIPMMAMIMSMVILYKIDLLPLTTHPEKTRSLRIALVQSNIPEKERWVPEALDNIINIHQYLTDSIESADLIVWPEAAIPESEDHIQPLLTKIQSEQKKRQRYLISGLITTDYHGHYYNGLRLFGNDNNPPDNAYRKYHLVPFGEFLPFEKQLKGLIGFFDIPMSNLSPGPQYQPLLDVRGIKIAPFICYEIAYTDQLQHYLPEADLLLVISNDAWFGHSWAAEQHLQIARWRALQAHRTLLFASNDGITAVIDNHGKIIKQLKPFIRGILEEILLL
jgi:apolipoprotein N-acyltransferase